MVPTNCRGEKRREREEARGKARSEQEEKTERKRQKERAERGREKQRRTRTFRELEEKKLTSFSQFSLPSFSKVGIRQAAKR